DLLQRQLELVLDARPVAEVGGGVGVGDVVLPAGDEGEYLVDGELDLAALVGVAGLLADDLDDVRGREGEMALAVLEELRGLEANLELLVRPAAELGEGEDGLEERIDGGGVGLVDALEGGLDEAILQLVGGGLADLLFAEL